jgi:membrane protein DedA with SNARE-associated domain
MSDLLEAILHLSAHDFSWLAQFFSLLVLPFAHEDLAILVGAYVVVNDIMPAGLVALSIYCGMAASDFALYAIGAGARRSPWLRRLAVDDRVRDFARPLERNLFGVLALCRVVPGLVSIAFLACGWARVPLRRFTAASRWRPSASCAARCSISMATRMRAPANGPRALYAARSAGAERSIASLALCSTCR